MFHDIRLINNIFNQFSCSRCCSCERLLRKCLRFGIRYITPDYLAYLYGIKKPYVYILFVHDPTCTLGNNSTFHLCYKVVKNTVVSS